jgi:hypothetical protein
VESDVGDLFSVPPGRFVATRDRLAAAARDEGDRRRAGEISRLRRPTVSAWAVNLLALQAPDELGPLLDIGAELRTAWAQGGGLGDAERRRSDLIARLVRRAVELAADAGNPVRDGANREIEETLNAATVDPEAAEQVRAGRLTRPLSHAGFAPPGILPVPATPISSAARAGGPPKRAPGRTAAPRHGEERRLRLRRLTVAVDNAADQVAATERDEAGRESELDEAQSALAAATDEVERLRAELRDRQADREKVERRVRLARREHERAVRAAAAARRNAEEARRRLDQAVAETGDDTGTR